MDGQTSSIFSVFQSLNKQQKIAIFAVLGFVVLAIGGVFLVQALRPGPDSEAREAASHIHITNFDEYAKEMPEYYRMQVEALIYNTLVEYNGVSKYIDADASIRADSYKEETTGYDGAYTSKFTVDIPSVEKSFVLDFGWIKGNNDPSEFDIRIDCPSYKDWVYENKSCATSNEPMDNLAEYLPAELDTEPKILLSQQTYSEYSERAGKSYLMVDIAGCENDAKLQEAKKIVKKWLEERFVNPVHVYTEYSFTAAICGG